MKSLRDRASRDVGSAQQSWSGPIIALQLICPDPRRLLPELGQLSQAVDRSDQSGGNGGLGGFGGFGGFGGDDFPGFTPFGGNGGNGGAGCVGGGWGLADFLAAA